MDKESLICSSLEDIAIPALVSMLEFLFVQELTPKANIKFSDAVNGLCARI